jgi:RES domain-containing protein
LRSHFRGVAFCHVPADEPIRLERLVSTDGEDDRWNRTGQPTVYLATELAIAIAEFARHLEVDSGGPPVRRRLLGLSLDVDGLLDVRRADVRQLLDAPADPAAFRDLETARTIGSRAREAFAASGLLVPSMAFADDGARANLVLFMECLGGDLQAIVGAQHEAGLIEVRPAASRG